MNTKLFSFSLFCALSFVMLSTAHPAQAAQTRSQKFQAAVDTYETQLNTYRKSIDEIQDIEDVNERYAETTSLLTAVQEEADTVKSVTLSKIYLANKKEKKMLKAAIHQFHAQMISYQRDADAALLVEDNGNGKAIDNALNNVLSNLNQYLESNDTTYHARLKSVLKGKVNQSIGFLSTAIDDAQQTHDLYLDFADAAATQDILFYISKANNASLTAQSYYDSGTAIRAENDLQLLNQAGREVLRARARLSTALALIADLEAAY